MARAKKPLKFGKYELPIHEETIVMGIVNITPDSFSDGGKYNNVEAAVRHAKQLVADGAKIIDIGGESTRPGFIKVEVEDEINRVVPIIEALSSEIDIPISIDTYKSEVAEAAIKAGASIINDVWGAKFDPKIADVAAKYEVPIIIMHNRNNRNYYDLMSDIVLDLAESIQIAKKAGVRDDLIILDPGIGFAKTPEQNLKVMNALDQIKALNYPLLLGTSKKSFIGEVLGTEVNERLEGTGATVCLGITKGCEIVRVHDVLPILRMTKMMDAMLGVGPDNG
ncbi:dihydropteroate synthase [Bacillus sp. RG28]|uniref:Dihydropteroate synthase n=1 Tax=Gottfriedia endophytica TaxID=2820819 RepID=A0A940NU87_9BACI|nr:dihydropteroate synthase [Gottfriedia endophytica]MBP0727237.1 dihydropteroate synthase [Gottfriedia endophytica]